MAQYDVDLREYWRILQKRKYFVILMVVLVSIFSYGFAKLKEPIPLYQTSSAIKIERTSNMANVMGGGFYAQSEKITTHAFILTSFPVILKTAQVLGWLPKDLTMDDAQTSQSSLAVLQRLKSIVAAIQQPGTNVLNIRVISTSAEEAAAVANALAVTYKNHNVQQKNKQVFEMRAFLEAQLGLTEAKLREAEENLQSFKENYSLVNLDMQAVNSLNRLINIEEEYQQTARLKDEIGLQIKMMEDKGKKSGGSEKIFLPDFANSPIQGFNAKLRELTLQRQTLLFEFTQQHPLVLEINDKINAVILETNRELKSMYDNLISKENVLKKKYMKLKEDTGNVPERTLQLNRLERELNLQETLFAELKTKHQEVLIQESGKVQEVSVVRPAVVPSFPINVPSKILIVFTGIIMGLILGVVFAFISETLDTSIGTIEDIEGLLKVPVIGVIPQLEIEDREKSQVGKVEKGGRGRHLITHFEPRSLAAEAFRSLRTNLKFISVETKGKVYLVTSSFVQEGKTFSIVNLALSMAQAGQRVLLVECDLRKPRVHAMFGLNKEPGLTDYVLGSYHWKEIICSITDVMLGDFEIEDILRTPGLDNMNIVTSGANPPNPSEILNSKKFRDFLKEIRDDYDIIFIDTPPVLPVTDPSEVAPNADGVIMVYKVGLIARGVLKRAKASLDNVNANVVGVILNNIKPETGPDYFKYHTQYYYDIPKKGGPGKGKKAVGDITQKVKKSIRPSKKKFRIAAMLLAMSFMALGIFYRDIARVLGLE